MLYSSTCILASILRSPNILITCSSLRSAYIRAQVLVVILDLTSGRICVPIDSSNPAAFDPFAVPTVTDLLNEIDSWQNPSDEPQTGRISDWEKTSLKPYIRYFKQHVDLVMSEERVKKRLRDEEIGGMAASD